MDGVIVVDKPQDWTSHDVVGKMRGIARDKRIGHLGTLDPIATGVLPLVIGRATRLQQFYTKSEKIYEATVQFGFSTDTYDRAGVATSPAVPAAPTRERIESALARFRGDIMQVPPPVSAKKVDGVRAYKLARKDKPVELPAVAVHIHELTLLDLDGPIARLLCHCSGGTYVRSIAHDLGIDLGYGAHLTELRRTQSGEFTIAHARTIPELQELANEGRLDTALVPATAMLPDFPAVWIEEQTVAAIRQGRSFPVSPFRSNAGSRYIKAVSRDGALIAIGEVKLPNVYHPIVVF